MTGRRRPRADPVRSAAFDVLRTVAERDSYANLVLPGLLRDRGITGRDAAAEIIEIADTVTEMVEVKHAYQQGVRAMRGIDY